MIQELCFLLCIVFSNAYRLPKDVMPEHYKLEVITYLGEKDNFNFDGKVWIHTACVRPTSNITLHSKHLNIKENEITVKDVSSKTSEDLKNLRISFDKANDFLIIHLGQELKEVHKYEIYIPFTGKLDDGLAGYYRSSYSNKTTKEKVWLGVTQFEAISARRAFPCFDEPEMKATFEISMGRKEGYKAISNMPLYATEPIKEKEGYYWDKFDSSVPMSTYLVAYIVSDFDYKTAENTGNNVTFRIWARKDALSQVDFAKDIGPKALEFYENFFDVKYPLPKQDMVAIPDFSAGAMENWGLITYREGYLLFDPEVSSKTSQHSVASVISHELAHQWFGNLVTMKWWTDLWLNEGFATYMASLAVDAMFPQWNSLMEEAAGNVLSVFSFDSLRTSHPVSVPIGDPKEIDEIFDTISYKKGSSLIRMMSLFLGKETLRKGVSNYLKKHKFGNAEQDDLWYALTEEAHKNNILPSNLTVKTIMDTWTLQTGYPVINVVRDYEKKTAEVSQRRFLRDIVMSKDANNPCWWVPLTYSTLSHLDFETTTPRNWLSCPQHDEHIENIANEDEWVIFNNQIAGLYKVNYDAKNWNLIIKALQSENYRNIPTLNRVQLISDAADLAFVGSLDYNIFFNLLKYLKVESEYLPWKAALGKTGGLTTYLKKGAIFGLYKDYMQKLLTPIYEKLGGFEVPKERSDKLDSIKLQTTIASRACRFEVENCVSHAPELFRKLQESPPNENPNIPTLNRVQLISDAADLAFVGSLDYNIFFNLLKYLKVESEYLPWKAALGKTGGLTTYLKKGAIFGLYKDYMQKLLTPIYEKLGGFEVPKERSDKLDSIKLQTTIASRACRFEVENCVSHAPELFRKLQESPPNENPIPKDLRGVVYCTALRQGGEAEWDFLWHKYQNSNVATEKNSILNALGCTKEIWILSRYLDWSLEDSKIRRQDSSLVFGTVARNDVGYYVAKSFFYENIQKIVKHLSPNTRRISRYLSALAAQMTDGKDQEELEHVIEKNQDSFSAIKQGVKQSLETVNINIQWQNKHADKIHDILLRHSKESQK